jgi:N-methylhydantoinase A
MLREMGIPRGIVPVHPAQFSAYGFIMTNARVDRQRTTQFISTKFDAARANSIMKDLVSESLAELSSQGYEKGIEVYRALEMRYLGQNYELELPLTVDKFTNAGIEKIWDSFHKTHKERFGFSTPGEIIEIVNFVVTAVARTAKPALTKLKSTTAKPKPRSKRKVWFIGGPQMVPVYNRADLLAGQTIKGPALIEESASVTVLEPSYRLRVHPQGHMLIDQGK